METNNRKQLVTQDNGNIEKIFPKNYMSNIVDEETGESLRIFLLKYNHIDLGYRSSKSSARLAVPIIMRRKGLYITYYLPDDVVITEFFNGNKTEVSDTNWIKDELWVKDVNELNVYDVKISDGSITLDKLSEEVMQLISSKGDITINNFPDNEDLELYTIYQDSNNKIDAIRFKDRDNSNGMAYKYLRKTKNMILSQSDFNQANTIYEIRYDFDLNGNTISIPDNCELKFIGGSLKNGTINFNNTLLSGDIKIKTNILGDIRNGDIYPEWFGAVGDGIIDDSNAFLTAFEIISNSFISIDKFRRVGYTNTLVLNTNKEYYITSSLELNSVSINIKGAGTLIYGGKNHCMKFTKCTGVNIDISFIAKSDFIDTYKVDWNDNPNRTAIILDGVRESNFKFDKIVGFTKGIVVTGDGNYGCYNNYFKLASMYNLYKSIVIESFNQYWPNDNVVEGGYFIGNIDEVANTIINSPTAIRSFIEINGDSIYPITSWKFKDCYFQGQLAVLTNGDNIVTKVFYANQYCKNFKFENIAIEDTTSSTGSVFHFNNDQCKDIEIDTIDYVDNYNFNYLGFISNDWNYLKRLHNITFKQREGLQEIYRINVSKYYEVPFRVESSTNDDGGILLSNDLNPIFDLKNSKFVNRYNPNKSFPISGNLLSVTKGQIYYYDLKPAGNIRIIFMKSDYSVLTSNEYNSQTDIDIFSNIGITLSTYQDKSYYITGSTNGTNLTINMLNNTLIKYIYVCSSNSTELIISQNKYSTAVKNFIFENNQYRNGGFIINQNINSAMLTALTGDRIYNLYDNKEYRIINSGTKGLDLSDITVTAIKGNSYITVTGNISKFKIGNIVIIDNYQYTIRSISGQSLYVTPSIQSSVTNTIVSFKKLIFEDSDKNVDGTLLSKEVIVRSIDEITLPNIIYKIVSDIDLNNTTLTLPANCTLDFQGGSFSNGTIVGYSTKVKGIRGFGHDLKVEGTWINLDKPEKEFNYSDYVFTVTYHNVTESSDKYYGRLMLYASTDGLKFNKISTITVPINHLILDPSIVYFNDTFYIIYDWTDTTYNDYISGEGGNRIGILVSKNLIDWENYDIDIPTSWKAAWAPDLFVDNNELYFSITTSDYTKEYTIPTSSTVRKCKNHAYICKLNLTDYTIAETTEMTSKIPVTDEVFNEIDPFIMKVDSTYYLFIKNEYTRKNSIYTSSTLTGNYTLKHTFNEVGEGVSVVKFNNRYYIYFIGYTNQDSGEYLGFTTLSTYMIISDNLETFTTPIWCQNEGNAYNRHSTYYLADSNIRTVIDNLLVFQGDANNADKWLNNKGYILGTGSDVVDYDNLLLQPDAVYYIDGGANVTINSVDCSLMNTGDKCYFILRTESTGKITFKGGQASMSGRNRLYFGSADKIYDAKNGYANYCATIVCSNSQKQCFFEDGIAGTILNSSTSANRPVINVYIGTCYFDTTLNKPIWAKSIVDGVVTWVDATGATV